MTIKLNKIKSLIVSTIIFSSFISKQAQALTAEDATEIQKYSITIDNNHYLEMIDTFKAIALKESISVQELVKEVQVALPDFASQVTRESDFWKLSYLLDKGWVFVKDKPNSEYEAVLDSNHKDLLTLAVGTGLTPIVDLVIKSGGWKILNETKINELLSGAGRSQDSAMANRLAAWKKNRKNPRLNGVGMLYGNPDTYLFEGEHSHKKSMRPQGRAAEPPIMMGAAPGAPAPKPKYTTIYVPYATNRQVVGDINKINTNDGAETYYSYNTSATGISYGVAEVSIPQTHEPGQLERLKLLQFTLDPNKHVMLHSLSLKSESEFYSAVGELMKGREALFPGDKNAKEVFVYVHGFNVDYNYAMIKTAQMLYDMDYPGLSLAYSWPARAVKIPLPGDFRDDVGRAYESVQYLMHFLVQLKKNYPDRKINIIAHSLGTRVLSQVLTIMARSRNPETIEALKNHFGEVILAAPAMDAKIFTQQFALDLSHVCDRISILASDDDIALKTESLAEDDGFSFPLGLWSVKQAALPKSDLNINNIFNFDLSRLSAGTFSLDHSVYSEVPIALKHMAHLLKDHPNANDLGKGDYQAYMEPESRSDFFSGEVRDFWDFFKN